MRFSPFPTMETERLLLRELAEADQDDLFLMRSDPYFHEFTDTECDTSPDRTKAYIENMRAGVADGRWIIWALVDQAKYHTIGTLGIWNIDENHHTAELSYGLASAYQGKGYMREALQCVIGYAFQQMNLEALEAYTEKGNHSSRNMLEKLHFQPVNHVDDASADGTRTYQMVVYRLKNTDHTNLDKRG